MTSADEPTKPRRPRVTFGAAIDVLVIAATLQVLLAIIVLVLVVIE